MLTETEVQKLPEKVYRLLADVGILVDNEDFRQIMVKKGCSSGPNGRVRIPRKLIDEMAAFQKKTQAVR